MAGLGLLLICAGGMCLLIGGVLWVAQAGENRRPSDRWPPGDAERLAPIEARPRSSRPPSAVRRGAMNPSPPGAARKAEPATSKVEHAMANPFVLATLGQTVAFRHPQRGPVTGQVLGRIHYTELWQHRRGPSEPWVPTGNTFVAVWLGSQLLYQWQSRLYVLDELVPVSDVEINQHFAPHAKRFGQGNQAEPVTFAWPPAAWTIVDIGRFRVALAEGAGLRLARGAEGRFIHAHGSDDRALIVEDFQSGGGGSDTAWIGWQLPWENLESIR